MLRRTTRTGHHNSQKGGPDSVSNNSYTLSLATFVSDVTSRGSSSLIPMRIPSLQVTIRETRRMENISNSKSSGRITVKSISR
ncbi:uncharacterized protein LOC117400829 isoform X2 [Acipenser ruthenus]|uniref:uncharacterized protein LOC117400829 isoform X2 n=1 Tax=Acipenser ruthenus TaxID=7906 RepID=UPI00274043C9|nr:uncharacterized protein LOC117400829 isoform X2 [Acipenser ruthenus]